MAGFEAQAVEQEPQQVGDLGPGRSAIEVQFVNDEVEDAAVLFEPLRVCSKIARVRVAHQHDAQHAEVRDEDVRRGVLHVPARAHLGAVEPGEEVADVFLSGLRRVPSAIRAAWSAPRRAVVSRSILSSPGCAARLGWVGGTRGREPVSARCTARRRCGCPPRFAASQARACGESRARRRRLSWSSTSAFIG